MVLQVDSISFRYAQDWVLEQISFEIEPGSFLAIIGESGSGKSTLCKALYGLLHLNQGVISWKGKRVMGPHFRLLPGEPHMKYVSQEPNLMPFASVHDNVAKHILPEDNGIQLSRIMELLALLGLDNHAERRVCELSGGQMKRVALAQALAHEPELLLLDEPFNGIDQFKRNEIRHQLFPYLKNKGITVIMATHDPEDILPFANICAVINSGKLEAFGETLSLYQNPKSLYTAQLFGPVNTVPKQLLINGGPTKVANVICYPHELVVTKESRLKVEVEHNFFKGDHYLISGKTHGQSILFCHKRAIMPKSTVNLMANIPNLEERTVDG